MKELSPEEVKAQKKSQELDTNIRQEIQTEHKVIKLLLLGAGESGKSTIFKQLVSIYGKGHTDEERRSYVSLIHSNIISGIAMLAKQSPIYGPVSPELEQARQTLSEMKGNEDLNKELAYQITALWSDPGIQATFAARSKFQIPDSAKYFLDQVLNIYNGVRPKYTPTNQDILRVRVRTTGIVETEFIIENNHFKMFDVGGQRNERKKWIHCFENVTAVVFVAAISEYDQNLYEDEAINRVTEALTLFEEICNSRWFKSTSMLLFLNKRDLFYEKLKEVPLSARFPDYQGNSYETACLYMKKIFETKNRHPDKKTVYTHITCATDTDNVQAVFNDVKDTVIRHSLDQSGLL